jgi:hypothetical protein
VSRFVGVEAKLIGATDTAGTQRRPRNKPETTADGGGAPLVRVVRGGCWSSASARVREEGERVGCA